MRPADGSGHPRLERAWRPLFVGERGDLSRDDTVVPNPFATAMEGLAWVFSRRERKPVYGFSVVFLIWTDGSVRLPRGRRLGHQGGPSQSGLAVEWRSSARPRRRCRPASVRCDAW